MSQAEGEGNLPNGSETVSREKTERKAHRWQEQKPLGQMTDCSPREPI